jgi:hypothetical protein
VRDIYTLQHQHAVLRLVAVEQEHLEHRLPVVDQPVGDATDQGFIGIEGMTVGRPITSDVMDSSTSVPLGFRTVRQPLAAATSCCSMPQASFLMTTVSGPPPSADHLGPVELGRSELG